ncbi:MAG: hypothetical protein KDC71_13320, partial [Acidobacteria bacterium]|nr:hypothetical protein [Acidobacteriota bacterium]
MVRPLPKPDLDWARQLIRSIRLNRSVGFLFTLVIMWPIIFAYSPLWAAVLAIHSLVWPHFVYYRTFHARSPLREEVKYIFADNALLGFWLGLGGFPVPLIALYLTTVTINTTIMGGITLFARGFGFMLFGCVLGGWMQGWHFFANLPTYGTVLTIIGLWLYGGMISHYSYTQAQGLIQVKRYLKQRNAELEALDEIVQTLNRETDYNRLLRTLLEKGMLLFPNSERAFFLEFDALTHKARTTASIGFPENFDAEGRPDLSLLED